MGISSDTKRVVSSVKKPVYSAEGVVFKVGSFKQSSKNVFRKEIDLYLKDSNAYGNIYFSRHFEWQGVLRESWFSECIFENMLKLEGCFITKQAFIEYENPAYPFQKIEGVLSVSSMKATSFNLIMSFYNTKTKLIVSKGYQKVVYTNRKGHISRLPSGIKSKMGAYLDY